VTRARRDESRRTIPKCPGKHQWLHLALAGLPNDMKVKADPKTGVVETPLMSFARDMAAGFGDNDATQAPSEIGGQDR